jgi:hypothetical protein
MVPPAAALQRLNSAFKASYQLFGCVGPTFEFEVAVNIAGSLRFDAGTPKPQTTPVGRA